MKPITRGCLPTVLALLSLGIAGNVLANDFAIVPDTSSGNYLTFQWSVSIDGAGASGNPTLEVMTGQTYTFTLTGVAFHPFWIDQSPGVGGPASNPYPYPSAALSDNGVTVNTTITMNLPADAPDTLYYACGYHSSMTGTINVIHDLVFRAGFDG